MGFTGSDPDSSPRNGSAPNGGDPYGYGGAWSQQDYDMYDNFVNGGNSSADEMIFGTNPGVPKNQKELKDIAKMNSKTNMDEGKAMTDAMDKAADVVGMNFSEFMEAALSTVKGVAAVASGNIMGMVSAVKSVGDVKNTLDKSDKRVKSEIEDIAKEYAKQVKEISGREVNMDEAMSALTGYRSFNPNSANPNSYDPFGGHGDEIIANLPPEEQEEGRKVIEGIQAEQKELSRVNDPEGFWNEFKTQFFDAEENAQALIDDHASFMADEANKYTDTIEGKGEVSPFNFKMLGQNVSFVPRPNREVAKSVFDVAATKSPVAGKLSYLDALMNPAELEEKKRATDILANLDQTKINNAYQLGLGNLDVAKDQLEQNEPGWLDYLGAGTGVLNGLFGEGGLFS